RTSRFPAFRSLALSTARARSSGSSKSGAAPSSLGSPDGTASGVAMILSGHARKGSLFGFDREHRHPRVHQSRQPLRSGFCAATEEGSEILHVIDAHCRDYGTPSRARDHSSLITQTLTSGRTSG